MVTLTSLWMPIVLSAVGVFFLSAIIPMLLNIHGKDYSQMPNEAAVLGAIRDQEPAPGFYTLPYLTDFKQLEDPDVKANYEAGPVAFVTVMPGGLPKMGKALGQWLVMCVIVSVFVAYVAGRTLSGGAEYLTVFRLVGTTAFLAYAGSVATESIWKGQPWANSCRHIFDGLLYSLVTAGFFGWLWPA